ncbi:MAG: toll/interleukin-1 receptor domain-containing protein [Acidobacteria bacterium]|nr:toll/interleukin-1 receptor domain-containing protein [Acidobacteriota bacterium]
MAGAELQSPAQVARLVLRCLAEGRRVEIERLGTFRPTADGGFRFQPNRKPSVFLAYAAEDATAVDQLYAALERAGFQPWMDRRKLLPGQNWPRAIEGAIETADFFVACLSQRAISKRGTFQSEIRYALDCARSAPIEDVYFIPLRLDDCRVPAQIQRQLQYVDLFPQPEEGTQKLIRMMRKEARRRRLSSCCS